MIHKTFQSINNYHSIDVALQGDTAYFMLLQYNTNEPKSFVLLLSEILNYMHLNNVEYIIDSNDFERELYKFEDYNLFQTHILNKLQITGLN
jgi:hypothetical protein